MRTGLVLFVFIVSCAKNTELGATGGSSGGATTTGGGTSGTTTGGTSGGSTGAGSTTGTDAGSTTGTNGGATTGGFPQNCGAAPFLDALGKNHFLTGYARDAGEPVDTAFDVRYHYLAGGLPDDPDACTPDKCAQSVCKVGGTGKSWRCYNSNAGYVDHLFEVANDATLMISYYELYQTAVARDPEFQEGYAEVTESVNDAAMMKSIFNDWRLALQKVGDRVALLQFEPDFWAFAEQYALGHDTDAHGLAALVTSTNPTDCADQEDSVAGFGRCVIAMARKYAPNALVSLHASSWASGPSILANKSASFDLAGEAAKTVAFLLQCGAGDSDYITLEFGHADAGYYQYYEATDAFVLDDTNASLPNFTQAWAFSKAITDGLGKPAVWWQIPMGNPALSEQRDDICDADRWDGNGSATYKDNRVDYIYGHMSEMIAAGSVGAFFGPGVPCDTTIDNDGGHVLGMQQAYIDSGYATVCPAR